MKLDRLNHSRPPSKGHVELIDYMRGVASVMVAWFHLTNTYGGGWIGMSGYYGWLGVEIFFVISGFVITLALCRNAESLAPRSFGTFMVKRLIRLEPPFIASVALAIGLLFIGPLFPGFRGAYPDVSAPQVAFHLAYLIPFTHYEWLQPIYWTLTYEFFFYIFAGLMIPLTLRQYGHFLFIAMVMLASALVVAGIVSHLIMLFALGIAACRSHLGRERLGMTIIVMLVSASAMVLVGHRQEAAVGLVSAVLLAGCTRIPRPPVAVVRLLSFFGAISYSLYLVHIPIGGRVVNVGRRLGDSEPIHLFLSLLAFGASVFAAVLFWRFIEKPALQAANRYDRKR